MFVAAELLAGGNCDVCDPQFTCHTFIEVTFNALSAAGGAEQRDAVTLTGGVRHVT